MKSLALLFVIVHHLLRKGFHQPCYQQAMLGGIVCKNLLIIHNLLVQKKKKDKAQ